MSATTLQDIIDDIRDYSARESLDPVEVTNQCMEYFIPELAEIESGDSDVVLIKEFDAPQ